MPIVSRSKRRFSRAMTLRPPAARWPSGLGRLSLQCWIQRSRSCNFQDEVAGVAFEIWDSHAWCTSVFFVASLVFESLSTSFLSHKQCTWRGHCGSITPWQFIYQRWCSISLPTLPLNWVELLRSWDKLPHQLLNDWKFHHSPSRLWNLRLQQQGTSSHNHASVTYIHPSPRANGNNEPLLLGLVRINKDMYWQRPYVRTYIHTVQQSRAEQRRAEQSTV